MSPRSDSLAIAVVGAGRVGTTLALMLRRRRYRIAAVVSRSLRSARRLAKLVRCPITGTGPGDIPSHVSCLLLALPEDEIHSFALTLSREADVPVRRLRVFHTSGALTSEVLKPLTEQGALGFSLHPIQSFPRTLSPEKQIAKMKNVWYGYEGPAESRAFAKKLVKDLGGKFLEVPKEEKMLYHIACVFASNYPVVLLSAVEYLGQRMGLRDIKPFRSLLESGIDNAFQGTARGALTGPIARGSLGILNKHMKELESREPNLLSLYSAIGLYGVELAKQLSGLSDESVHLMQMILSGQHDR